MEATAVAAKPRSSSPQFKSPVKPNNYAGVFRTGIDEPVAVGHLDSPAQWRRDKTWLGSSDRSGDRRLSVAALLRPGSTGASTMLTVGSGTKIFLYAHARRKFEDAKDYPADCRRWMQWFQDLCDLETQAKKLSAEQRLKLRQSEALSIRDLMEAELASIDDRTEQVVLPKSELRKALNYTRNHWPELTGYLSDASLPMDNNECEQLINQVAIGRKNWMFAGSVAGGERTAGFITLASSAHRNDLDVWTYVNDVLKQLLAGQTDYDLLLPWNWAKSHPEAIRKYRQDERRQRDVRKEEDRDRRRANKARQAKLKKIVNADSHHHGGGRLHCC